jgi:hypothetical protein
MMRNRLLALFMMGALSATLLTGIADAQGKQKGKAQNKQAQQMGCCQQGCCMNGGKMGGMQGRGPGMMRGMQRGRGPMMRGMKGTDMMTARQLVMLHEKVTRAVKQLPNGVDTLTESDDPAVIAKIKEHVPAMYARLKENRPIHQIDPLFVELFRYGKKINAEVSMTDFGVRVIETSSDPYVVKLIKAHAKSVDELIERGMPAMHEKHAVPKK